MNYNETISYLFTRLPMYSRIGAAAYKADLDHIRELCQALDNPQDSYKTIHLAGTNGKGSCSHMLAAILQVAGYKVGLHTSPHLHDFRERIRVNGEMANEEFVVSFTAGIQPMIDRLDPSFFEISVAMAFEYFRQQQVDVAIIETGLGGRLDSTNIITPVLSVITNIGWDHMNLLGDTLQKIAGEKAGIIKPGVPVVVGETIPETKPVFEQKAAETGSPLLFARELYEVMEWSWKGRLMDLQLAARGQTDHLHLQTDLPGIYQLKNIQTVMASVDQLRRDGWIITDDHIRRALPQVKKLTGLRGRWDIISQDPLLVLDVAHNIQGMEQLIEQLEVTDHEQLHIVFGAVNDKDITRLLEMMPVNAHYYFTQAQIPRAKAAGELKSEANAAGLKGESWPDVNQAISAAKDKATNRDMILVCGSIFLVAEVHH